LLPLVANVVRKQVERLPALPAHRVLPAPAVPQVQAAHPDRRVQAACQALPPAQAAHRAQVQAALVLPAVEQNKAFPQNWPDKVDIRFLAKSKTAPLAIQLSMEPAVVM